MSELIVYIDRSRILPGKLEELKPATEELVGFIEAREYAMTCRLPVGDTTNTLVVPVAIDWRAWRTSQSVCRRTVVRHPALQLFAA